LLNAFVQWYASQANATYTNLTNFLASQPRFVGTIRMDAATSTWLRTTLNELQKWQAVGAPGSFAPVSLPAVPAAIAPAAAAAVAVAWAASRRDDDVAATAAVAGIALTLFGILMTLVYGTESLTLVALGVIVAAAAAAWRRIS
jgi:VIT1/CCC1 family predicted Fe2+/Mn2+ transporter